MVPMNEKSLWRAGRGSLAHFPTSPAPLETLTEPQAPGEVLLLAQPLLCSPPCNTYLAD